ncbi:hypothetical protein D3273_23465 [Lichenibacterium minor]|uniref:Uncharacterized protein n=1 Tax=Lichenibacterium minor TaxID=2316528 RepID=A0A4Q2U3T0_9HYPH|nr:hypothetical protein [Lichenibacterium minor]RYC29547.1 hypothetical protein D3273_23465 [Lichenibacterium minor]
MSTADQDFVPPLAVVREVVRARRIAAHLATEAMLGSLAPEPTADIWMDLGEMASRAVGKLARRTGYDFP